MPTEDSSILHWKTENYYVQNHAKQKLRDACFERVNWEALLQYASSQNFNRPCKLLKQYTIGGIHLIRLLSFGDTSWVVRIQLEPSTPATACVAQAEIDAMELIRARTSVPIPKIFGYAVNDDNAVRAAYTLMEFLPGCSAMDADGGYEVHRGQIPRERKETFFMKVARIQVEIASVRMSKIGTITRRADGSFDIGPIPKLGGPFSTATDFFRAWATYMKFPSTEDDIRSQMHSGPVEEVLSSISTFRSLLYKLASNISADDAGPFPVYHPDFYHSNIIVNPSFEILGVIDWEGTCTVPWEMVEFPLFLSIVAPAMDDPKKYDKKGRPKDPDKKRRVEERVQYAKHVQQWEDKLKKDGKLSEILLNPDIQGLAHAMKVYIDPGKLGFYDRILKPFAFSK